jgi:hypothetical protein
VAQTREDTEESVGARRRRELARMRQQMRESLQQTQNQVGLCWRENVRWHDLVSERR